VGARSSSSKNPQLPQQQQQRAPGETRKIHQRHGIGCVPVKLLYSESLTKVTKPKYRQSEAGNEKFCYELHARSGLRFIIRHQEDA
jgi:hypothetical protein